MADVFISYHRSESASALVARIVGELEKEGISCWYDTKDPKLGYFSQTITDKIKECKAFLLLWDKGANESRYCIAETHYAFSYAKGALIVPFQVGDFVRDDRLSLYTGPFQILFGGESAETARTDELIKKIAAEIGPPPAKIIKRGECGDNVTYKLDANGVLTISGAGPMDDYPNIGENAPWWDERETIFRARILNGVTSIGWRAFEGCASLASVDIPDSVTSIGRNAFWDCISLASVNIPDSVTEIERGAFWRCESLASVDIPDSVTSIGLGAFDGCASLASVDIPDSVTYIERHAFYGCRNLKSVSVPAGLDIRGAFPDTTQVIRRPPRK